ncbi:hypothetical protein AB685_24450 [Bacillus sp. LL01]|uniref:hypothetical protein n=1 Tax=Bacillus sp. LL01 TaxID=1665556 RepID=UPI00064D01E6|nr:hypothetical protein [Bacillus sp. LL01]KMJ55972.1 hypothetical protein AB685_24450 [Bacillus sp. LL01]
MTLEDWITKKPTLEWKQRLEEDEDYEEFYSHESIAATNQTLDSYINDLKGLPSSPTQDEIIQCVKRVVLKLNDVNEEYDDFIETEEREELYEFIDGAARTVGLEEDGDCTEEWREW